MESNPFTVPPATKPGMTQVYQSSFHQALSLRLSGQSASSDIEERDLFLLTPNNSMQTPWAKASFPNISMPADQPSTSTPVYGSQNHAMFPSHMTATPHNPSILQPPLQPRPDLPMTMPVTQIQPDQQQLFHHHNQQQQQQHQEVSAACLLTQSGTSEGEGAQRTSFKVNNGKILKGKKRKQNNTFPEQDTAKKKRCSNPLEWKKKKKKILRDKGEEYVTMQGKLKKARSVQRIDCTKCRFRCSEKIPEEAREAIHKVYWNLASYERQRAFIAQHVEQNDIKQVKSKTGARREVANSFFFVHKRKEHRVCKAFFTKTLDITSKVVDYTMKKTECGVYVGRDERGRRDPVNKTKPEDAEFIRWHINSFPLVDDAKGKKNKNRKRYLSHELNVGKMYKLYKEVCGQTGKKVMGISVYRNIFNHDFNLAFEKPKKEHCANCKCGEKDKGKMKNDCDSTNTCNNNIPSHTAGLHLHTAVSEPSVFF